MKHAGPEALDQLDSLLNALSSMPGLHEKKRGVYYRRSRAFLHFHEDPTGLYVDVRLGDEFERMSVTTAEDQNLLLRLVREHL